jgi:NAD(P)-dependent dehydrogenase (short-subunit alcohol dehydrogenase family)
MPKKILLTGCTKGCGAALALFFADQHHTVIGCGRDKSAVERTALKLGAEHHVSAVDVASDSQVSEWARCVIEKYGPPELVINNAAIIHHNAPLWQIPSREFDSVIDVNIKGTANVLRHFLPAMVSAKRGIIVNFSSGWGRSTSPEVSAYCATKWAIEGLTKSLSQELPSGMAAIALNPGIIDTDMLRSCFGESAKNYPSPQYWAKIAAPFILSLTDKNNGQSLDIPGTIIE